MNPPLFNYLCPSGDTGAKHYPPHPAGRRVPFIKDHMKRHQILLTGMEEVISLENTIRDALPAARKKAGRVGSQHAMWETILDGEAILAGKQTLLQGTRLARLRTIADQLTKG